MRPTGTPHRLARPMTAALALLALLPLLQGFHTHQAGSLDGSAFAVNELADVDELSTECLFCAAGSLKFSGSRPEVLADILQAARISVAEPVQSLTAALPLSTGSPRAPPYLI